MARHRHHIGELASLDRIKDKKHKKERKLKVLVDETNKVRLLIWESSSHVIKYHMNPIKKEPAGNPFASSRTTAVTFMTDGKWKANEGGIYGYQVIVLPSHAVQK